MKVHIKGEPNEGRRTLPKSKIAGAIRTAMRNVDKIVEANIARGHRLQADEILMLPSGLSGELTLAPTSGRPFLLATRRPDRGPSVNRRGGLERKS
jgi:hypothetical protein